MRRPDRICVGDKIAIVSPATEVKSFWVKGAVEQLEAYGYRPVVMPHAVGCVSGTYAATDAGRLGDLRDAIADPEIKGILCARGGYGCNHLLSRELQALVSRNPKWMIGFSDVSALHALWLKAGVMSLHASMAKQLALYDFEARSAEVRECGAAEYPEDEEERSQLRRCMEMLKGLFSGEGADFVYTQNNIAGSADPKEAGAVVCGEASGRIVGGNLAVLNGLAATPWDILSAEYLRGKILFLEDVGEKIYQVERMLKRLQLAGVFDAVAGVVFGQFTEYRRDANFPSMEAMIAARMKEWKVECPVAVNFPIGHTHFNLPITEGAEATLRVSPTATTLTYHLSDFES